MSLNWVNAECIQKFLLISKLMNLLTYADGERDLIEIADLIGTSVQELKKIAEHLNERGLLVYK